MTTTPRVSIGMPLYNAEPYVERALKAILSQTYTDFELIVSDNASIDGTWEICQKYAEQDSRIRLHRNERNEGAIPNFNRVFDLAVGTYFMWAAHDDLWEPTFVATCLHALNDSPEAALCYVEHKIIDETTKAVTHLPEMDFTTSIGWRRVCSILRHSPTVNIIIYGLFRRSLLQQMMPIVNGAGAPDTILLARLAATGPYICVNQPLHTYTRSRRDIQLRLRQMQFRGSSQFLVLLSSDFALFRNLIHIVNHAAVGFGSWLRLMQVSLQFMYRITGWPISKKLLSRYISVILPQSILTRLVKPSEIKAREKA